MSEQQLRNAFRELTAEVKPSGTAYPRLMRRKVRETRSRTAGWASAALGVGLAFVLVPMTLTGGGTSAMPYGQTPPPASPPPLAPMSQWVRKLIESPTRGSFANDANLLTELSATAKSRAESYPSLPKEHKLLFAGEVGEFRIVISAFYNSEVQTALFQATERETPLNGGLTEGLSAIEPYFKLAFRRSGPSFASVGLAPEGCVVATKASQDWGDSGSFVAKAVSPGEWTARVTCDGTVRYEGPLADTPHHLGAGPVTSSMRAKAIEGMIGDVDSRHVDALIGNCVSDPRTRVRIGGPVPPLPGNVYAATCPGPFEVMQATVLYQRPGEQGLNGHTYFFPETVTQLDVAGFPLEGKTVIVAPPETVKVQLLSRDGEIMGEAPVTGRAAVTEGFTSGYLRALDRFGANIGTGAIATLNPPSLMLIQPPVAPRVNDWRDS
ncbi:hypothetical protein [Catelliglobosispora koreensis]|uniref:hypothetical protein n=1 Tax=Catelliglobosispora koreensis TaxID=129052 RepID=UPI000372BBCD|nr:hypothetical protein [Catelliglobosispora koreensis]